jgi:hypothetical protein
LENAAKYIKQGYGIIRLFQQPSQNNSELLQKLEKRSALLEPGRFFSQLCDVAEAAIIHNMIKQDLAIRKYGSYKKN